MAIDANAMYRAGFSSKSTGRDVARDERNERLNAITKTAFNILGQAAIGQIKQNYRGLQEYRNASDSQTALLNLQVDKMPALNGDYAVSENESLKGSILELKSLYDAAARKASFGIGKGRNKGRQDMARYMKQLSDMNAVLEIYKTSREKSKAMLGVLSGVTNSDEGVKTISSGSNAYETDNTTQQATGALGARLRWNIETGEMEVQVGGEWGKDDQGRNVYVDKAETGTYEEYVAENQEMKNKLFEKFKAENVNSDGMVTKVQSYEDWEKSQGEDIQPGSREDWTKQNQENRGAVSTILYKNMKFAVESDGMMADTMRGIKSDILKASYRANAVPWERVAEKYYGELQAKIGDYNDDQFKDYYFGGDTFDHSSGRMSESAPAYQRLLAEDESNGTYKDGKFAKEYGPGSPDWEGRLLALKGQSFVKGSFYRKEATDKIFENFKTQYTDNVASYKADNPEKAANFMVNGSLMSPKDYNAAYGPDSEFTAFITDETVLEKTQSIEFPAPSGKEYQRRYDGYYMLTKLDDDGNKVYDKKVTTDQIKRNEKLPGMTQSIIPYVGDDGDGDGKGNGALNDEDFNKLPDGEQTGLLGPLIGSKFKFRKVNGVWYKLKVTSETMYKPDSEKVYNLNGKATEGQITRIKKSYSK
jgi:hypothetical protein